MVVFVSMLSNYMIDYNHYWEYFLDMTATPVGVRLNIPNYKRDYNVNADSKQSMKFFLLRFVWISYHSSTMI